MECAHEDEQTLIHHPINSPAGPIPGDYKDSLLGLYQKQIARAFPFPPATCLAPVVYNMLYWSPAAIYQNMLRLLAAFNWILVERQSPHQLNLPFAPRIICAKRRLSFNWEARLTASAP